MAGAYTDILDLRPCWSKNSALDQNMPVEQRSFQRLVQEYYDNKLELPDLDPARCKDSAMPGDQGTGHLPSSPPARRPPDTTAVAVHVDKF